MNLLQEFTSNQVIRVAFVSWFLAQLFKIFTCLMVEKKLDIRRFVESGGMPSSHTSTVIGATYATGCVAGVNSPIFAIALVFSMVVMYDAAGVRRQAGQHAALLNQLVEKMESTTNIKLDKNLKELLGHTPFEVFGGTLLGLLVGFFMC